MLPNSLEKIKRLATERKADLYVALLIILVSITSFGLGRLSAIWPKKEPITIKENDKLQMLNAESRGINSDKQANSSFGIKNSALGKFVASKNGKSYHLPWCSGALLIKEENRLWFQTKGEAERAGYTAAGNCPGI